MSWSSRMLTSNEARKFTRYDVVGHTALRGHIYSVSGSIPRHLKSATPTETLVTIALGGCGFLEEREGEATDLSEGRRITCVFEMEGVLDRPVAIDGEIVYSHERRARGRTIVYCGVRFSEEQQERLLPIISRIENERAQPSL